MTERINGELLASMIEAAKINLCNHKEELNALNVFPVPDGDTGTNMSMTFTSAANNVRLNVGSASEIMDGVSMAALRGARGNSGVITSQVFRGICYKMCITSWRRMHSASYKTSNVCNISK